MKKKMKKREFFKNIYGKITQENEKSSFKAMLVTSQQIYRMLWLSVLSSKKPRKQQNNEKMGKHYT